MKFRPRLTTKCAQALPSGVSRETSSRMGRKAVGEEGIALSQVWGEEVSAVLHHVPEDEGFEGGYEAETMARVPNTVRITGTGEYSKEAALDHLVGGLALLGFRGRLVVDDVTEPDRNDRYRIEIRSGLT